MISQIGMTFRIWFEAIIKPGKVFGILKSNPDKLSVSIWMLFFFSLMYSFTALILYSVKVLPAIDPWIPVAKEQYYLFQTFWTIPWGLATGIMLAGITYIVSVIGHKQLSPYSFEDTMLVTTVAWVIPSFVLMWLPETLIVPFFRGSPWPEWVDILRLGILSPIWYIVLLIIGLRKTIKIGLWRGLIIALVFNAISFGMFLPIMR
jgi:hypothetical protein